MNTDPRAIIDFLLKYGSKKQNSELLKKFSGEIDSLCKQCQQDRIQCSITPLCSRRYLLKLRIKSGAKLEDLPKFCYRQLVNMIARDKEKKRTLYKPRDSYIYLLDFLAIFFPKHYRALFKSLSFRNYIESIDVLESFRKQNKDKFRYLLKEKHLLIEFHNKLYVVFLKEQYVCCNLKNEPLYDINLLEDVILFLSTEIPGIVVERTKENNIDVWFRVENSNRVDLERYFSIKSEDLKEDDHSFGKDIGVLTDISNDVRFSFDESDDFNLKLNFKLKTNTNNQFAGKESVKVSDVKRVFNIFNHLINKIED